MLLTADQIAYLRSELGDSVALEDLQARYDRLGNVRDVVMEITREHLNAMLRAPAQFSVDGTYSQSSAENIKALERKLTRLANDEATGAAVEGAAVLVEAKAKPRSRRS